MIKVGIIGGAGYTAGELIRLLLNHPDAEITFVNSTSNAGNKITDVHSGLYGETDLIFTDELPLDQIDLLFFCTAHGDTKKFMESHTVPENVKIIDLSMDYRIESPEHDFVYGLPELNRRRICNAQHIANPGCFATCIQLAVLPLAKHLMLNSDLHVNAITGSTGAGVKPSSTSHFSWRNDNISIYKPFTHQHLAEIGQSLRQLQNSFNSMVNFIPVRGNFSRGIFATTYLDCKIGLDEIKRIYEEYYADFHHRQEPGSETSGKYEQVPDLSVETGRQAADRFDDRQPAEGSERPSSPQHEPPLRLGRDGRVASEAFSVLINIQMMIYR